MEILVLKCIYTLKYDILERKYFNVMSVICLRLQHIELKTISYIEVAIIV